MSDSYRWDPKATRWSIGRPPEPPRLDPVEEAKLRKMAELFADTPEHRAARARERCLARMLDLVEGKAKPGTDS